jgi:hypothetical protein
MTEWTEWLVEAAPVVVVLVVGIVIWKIWKIRKRANRVTARPAQPVRTGNRSEPPRVRTVPVEERTETGPMVYYANDTHGGSDREYRFNYKKVNGSWRAYILKMPSLGQRQSDGFVTHRLYDDSKPYVCWNCPVNTLHDMQTISRVWADNIQEYIATGKKFG